MQRSESIKAVSEEASRYAKLKASLSAEALDEQTLLDTLEGETNLHGAILEIVDSIQADEDMAAAIGLRIDALNARRSRLESTAETKRNIILMAMERAGLKQVKGAQATVSVREIAPKVVIENEADVPARFWKQPDPVVDKKAVNDAVKEGAAIPGVRLTNGGIGLTIRVK